jgi:hypothetical protein
MAMTERRVPPVEYKMPLMAMGAALQLGSRDADRGCRLTRPGDLHLLKFEA